MLFSSQKGLAKMLSLSADSGVESLNKHKSALQNQAKNTTFKNFILGTRNVRSVGQGGRSMIEMLGVLAIIGVLSVGGIAGYSKAMMKVKINKTIDEVSQAAANIQTLYKSQTDYSGLECCDTSSSNSCDLTLCRKAKIVPEEFFVGDSKLVNPFDGSLAIYSAANNAQDIGQEAFTINIDGIPQDACIELATLDWGATNSGLIAIGLSIDSYVGPASYEGCPGSQDKATACVGGSSVSVPMPISLAAENCYEDSSRNRIIITFH